MHLLIGIYTALLIARDLSARSGREFSALRIEVTGRYWHFVDIVWIFLYPLLYLVSRA